MNIWIKGDFIIIVAALRVIFSNQKIRNAILCVNFKITRLWNIHNIIKLVVPRYPMY